MTASHHRPPLLEELRDRTRSAHEALEASRYAVAVAAGTLPPASYRGALGAMHTLHEALERAVATSPLLALRPLAHPERLERLRSDLQHLQPLQLPESPRAGLEAEVAAARLRVGASLEPCALLGWVYVLEGAALGNLAQRPDIARGLGLQAAGLSFLAGEGKATRARFERAIEVLHAVDPQGDAREAALGAAVEAFGALGLIFDALVPLDATPLEALVEVVNPDAGRHVVAGDLQTLAAAFRAGERTWRENPYYAARYGERGMRFTRSDSGWLAALGGCETAHVVSQVRWLAGVLAARGMPSLLLEQHLRTLHDELRALVPPPPHQPLLEAAQGLAAARAWHLAPEALEAIAAAFDQQVPEAERVRLPRTGRLLAAAVADEAAGHAHAVSSLESWLSDPARFGPRWIHAVQQTVALAREKVKR